ncbi:RNase A-like domain-containing protein [Nocardioides sp.]|uniref:RNase A-like domain-containing protein n=1 Tax=Nocardioides sp. TaxID=35761 RepID=UPI003782D854
MRLAVEGTGYQGAVEAYVTGNHLAADACIALADDLVGCAGMAGDDTTATEFAASYDEAAAASLEALGELTFGLASLGHLAAASLHNHAWAETVAGPTTLADRAVGVRPAAPPSALGADSSSLPGWADVVLDLLQGVFWPTADTDRLRAAAASWSAAGTAVGLLGAHCTTALAALEDEVSPEIPLAVATTEDLRACTASLADQLVALGTACASYADQVDAKRAELLDLLEELAWELGAGALLSGALTFFTGGAAAPAAGTAGAARVAAASAKVRGILDSLAVLSRGTATTLRPVAATLRDSRAYLARLAAARRMEMTERGSVNLGAFFDRNPFRKGFLDAHEQAGGHTLLKHVGKSDEDLAQRFITEPDLRTSSTFTSKSAAEHAIERVFRANESSIQSWLATGKGKEGFSADLGHMVGRVLVRGAVEATSANRARIVLVRDDSLALGWRLLTSYPTL